MLNTYSFYKSKRFYVSSKTGFIIDNPCSSLPKSFEIWNETAKQLADLTIGHTLRSHVHAIEEVEVADDLSYRELRLLHLILSATANCYVWQEDEEGLPKSFPKCLAKPLHEVSKRLGMKPIVCHADLALANAMPHDHEAKFQLDNMKTIISMPGKLSADWFFLVTAQIELDAVAAVNAILDFILPLDLDIEILNTTQEKNLIPNLITALNLIKDAIEKMSGSFDRMKENLTPHDFYTTVRPFLNGYKNVIFQGVSDEPFQFSGASAAQCTVLQCFDEFLGIKNNNEFLMQMRTYMPPAHATLVEYLAKYSPVQGIIHSDLCTMQLKAIFNDCIDKLTNFRSKHIQLVVRYITIPAKTHASTKDIHLKTTGTGGQPLITFLKSIRQSTQANYI